MDDALVTIAEAKNPHRAAATHDVQYRDGRVRVEIQLVAADEPTPPEVATVNNRRGVRVDAFVPIDELRPLADRDDVAWVQPARELQQHHVNDPAEP